MTFNMVYDSEEKFVEEFVLEKILELKK